MLAAVVDDRRLRSRLDDSQLVPLGRCGGVHVHHSVWTARDCVGEEATGGVAAERELGRWGPGPDNGSWPGSHEGERSRGGNGGGHQDNGLLESGDADLLAVADEGGEVDSVQIRSGADLAPREQGLQPLEMLARAALLGSLEGQVVAAPRPGPARATYSRLALRRAGQPEQGLRRARQGKGSVSPAEAETFVVPPPASGGIPSVWRRGRRVQPAARSRDHRRAQAGCKPAGSPPPPLSVNRCQMAVWPSPSSVVKADISSFASARGLRVVVPKPALSRGPSSLKREAREPLQKADLPQPMNSPCDGTSISSQQP